MDYELNLAGTVVVGLAAHQRHVQHPDDAGAVHAAVPASKVILGTPFFGIDWPTNNGTMAAGATGGAGRHRRLAGPGQRARVLGPGDRHGVDELPGRRPVARVVLRGRERPVRRLAAGVARTARAASASGRSGMESDGAQMIAALDGISPGAPPGTGPQSTSSSAAAQAAAPAPRPPRPRPRPGGGGASASAAAPPARRCPPRHPARHPTSGSGGPAGVAVGRGGTHDHHHGSRRSPASTTGPRST